MKYKHFNLPKNPEHFKNHIVFKTIRDSQDNIDYEVGQITLSVSAPLVHEDGTKINSVESRIREHIKQGIYEDIIKLLVEKLNEAVKDLKR